MRLSPRHIDQALTALPSDLQAQVLDFRWLEDEPPPALAPAVRAALDAAGFVDVGIWRLREREIYRRVHEVLMRLRTSTHLVVIGPSGLNPRWLELDIA